MLEIFGEDATAQINAPYVCKGEEEIAKHFREVIAKRGPPREDQFRLCPSLQLRGPGQRDTKRCTIYRREE
jgi:hypothetical protein